MIAILCIYYIYYINSVIFTLYIYIYIVSIFKGLESYVVGIISNIFHSCIYDVTSDANKLKNRLNSNLLFCKSVNFLYKFIIKLTL